MHQLIRLLVNFKK